MTDSTTLQLCLTSLALNNKLHMASRTFHALPHHHDFAGVVSPPECHVSLTIGHISIHPLTHNVSPLLWVGLSSVAHRPLLTPDLFGHLPFLAMSLHRPASYFCSLNTEWMFHTHLWNEQDGTNSCFGARGGGWVNALSNLLISDEAFSMLTAYCSGETMSVGIRSAHV